MKHKIFALLLILLLGCYGVKAQDNNWAFDPYQYQYDMTAYVGLNVDGTNVNDLARYKVGAFCGEDCRGIMDVRTANMADNSGTFQYGYLRIRSNNDQQEQITFKVYDNTTGKELKCEDILEFTAQAINGVPSSLMMLSAANKYKVDYVAFDEVFATEEVYYGEAVPSIEPAEKEGYTFERWINLPETMPAQDITITASYTINSYKLTFKIGNEIISESVVEYGSEIVEPEDPQKEGYTFAGWETHPETMPAYDLVINGHYEGNSYKLTYIIDGEVIEVLEVEFGTLLEAIEAPEKEGYTFDGWADVPETMPANDVTVTGSYSINSYTLTFLIDGEIISETTKEYGSEIFAPEAPEKEGYTFDGWITVPETMPANDVTVTGSYSINSYILTFLIDGEIISETTKEYGSQIFAPDPPEKEGYIFNGWEDYPETMPAGDLQINGFYKVNTYQLTYIIDDEVIYEAEVEYGSVLPIVDAPEKEGYTFDGWADVPETMPASDVTISGSYTVNTYTVTYLVDDEVIRIDTVEYGQSLPDAPEAPVIPDYEFKGWSEIPETMPAEDIIIVGTYEYAAGLNCVYTDSDKGDVYDIQGRLIKKGIDLDRVSDQVPDGLYIINGKKVLVK